MEKLDVITYIYIKKHSCSPRLHLFDNKYNKTYIVKCHRHFFFFFKIRLNCSPVMTKYFQHHYYSLQCHVILQKSFYVDLLYIIHKNGNHLFKIWTIFHNISNKCSFEKQETIRMRVGSKVKCFMIYLFIQTTSKEVCSGVDYFDVFISCLDPHSDGTHSLQRIHWWASDILQNFLKAVRMKKET